jgi:hypothetical protein
MMRKMLLAALLLVPACSEPAENVPAIENAALPEPARPKLPPATGPSLTEIPPAFRGRWGLVPADCEPGRSDAKGLITVEPKALVFYESRGVPEAILQAAPESVSLDVAFTGEGQTWRRAVRLSVRGDVLVREEETPQLSFTYRRCPA